MNVIIAIIEYGKHVAPLIMNKDRSIQDWALISYQKVKRNLANDHVDCKIFEKNRLIILHI